MTTTTGVGEGVPLIASLARHLALSPVAFAVTEGPSHSLGYANAAFHRLLDAGEIVIEKLLPGSAKESGSLGLILDRAFNGAETIRDEPVPSGSGSKWNCTVWPYPSDANLPIGLVMEVRDAGRIEGALARQRAIAERLLLAALSEQDAAREATQAGRRDAFLASASRDLSMSLDQDATRAIVRGRTLPRAGTWCIVDVLESNGGLHRLAVLHPDPAKEAIARSLTDHWSPEAGDPIGVPPVMLPAGQAPTVISHDSGDALIAAAHGVQNLAVLRQLGFGSLLVVPLVVRAKTLGAITFVTPEGDSPFSTDEITLASDLAARCAMALDNARLYHEADALRAAADTANRAKSDFLGNMSHELRTPLNVIGGYAELIEMGLRGPVTAEQRTDLTRIRQNQQHLLRLITDILNFVRTESGRMEYQFAEVPIGPVLDDAVEMISGPMNERNLKLDRRAGDADAMVWADRDRVLQILINLLINAVKYNLAEGGAITLSYTQTRYDVIIQVADCGPGIPTNMLDAIFEPFVQLESGLTNRTGGVGLGLAISRDIARAMNGDLTVDSTVGVGSRFTLTLPRAFGESAQDPLAEARHPA